MIKYIIITAMIIVKMNADILDNAINFWYVDKTYKQTRTYRYWSHKKKKTHKANKDMNIVQNAVDFWYIHETYKQTKTYNYYSDKKELLSNNYRDYKRYYPYRAVAIESLLETGVIAVGLIGIVQVGVPYILHSYPYFSTVDLGNIYAIPKYIKPKEIPYTNKLNTLRYRENYYLKDGVDIFLESKDILSSIQNDSNKSK